MSRVLLGLLILMLSAFNVTSDAIAQEKQLKKLVAKFPTPAQKDGKLADVDKKATDAAVAEFLKNPKESVVGLVNMLSVKEDDVQVQHAIHAIVISAGKNKAQQESVAQALASTLNKDRPKPIQKFVIRELQLIGTAKETDALGRLLLDVELAEPAAQTLLAIKTDAAEHFRTALPKVSAKQRALIVHGLGVLKDKKAAAQLRKILNDKDRDTRLTAAFALARLPDAESADVLLKMADGAKGYERARLTDACFRLAENLLAADDNDGARQVYSRLQKSRTAKNERYVREAAAQGLKKVK